MVVSQYYVSYFIRSSGSIIIHMYQVDLIKKVFPGNINPTIGLKIYFLAGFFAV